MAASSIVSIFVDFQTTKEYGEGWEIQKWWKEVPKTNKTTYLQSPHGMYKDA